MRTIDLAEVFKSKAVGLEQAVRQGRTAHRAGNIKASGAPLESAFRQLLQNGLPSSNCVTSGYFYGARSSCSPEADVLIYRDEEAFRLDAVSIEQDYVPYTSVSVIGQIKNSVNDLIGAVGQVAKCRDAWYEMRKEVAEEIGSGDVPQQPPLSFVVCGSCDGVSPEKIMGQLRKSDCSLPDYILLLDRGEIVAGVQDALVYDPPTVGFQQYRSKSAYYLCKPECEQPDAPGLALLWLYFALASRLSSGAGGSLRYGEFCRQVERLYPLLTYEKILVL